MIDREAVKFRGYFTDGKGAGKLRNPKGWRQSWMTWVGKVADHGVSNGTGPPAPVIKKSARMLEMEEFQRKLQQS